jgi:hypothetical protein
MSPDEVGAREAAMHEAVEASLAAEAAVRAAEREVDVLAGMLNSARRNLADERETLDAAWVATVRAREAYARARRERATA